MTRPVLLFDLGGVLVENADFEGGRISPEELAHRFVRVQSWLDHAFFSHRTGRLKPDPDSFRFALDALGVPPEQVVFFDDSLRNVEAARRLGIQSHHVEGFEACVTVLCRMGLLGVS